MRDANGTDFMAKLREHGVQVTYQRLAIYQALNQAEEHLSAEVIYQQVRQRFPMISLGTVYKTLEKFLEVGLVQRVGPITEVARYETSTDPHHHSICVECQAIRDIVDPIGNQEIRMPEDSRFHVLSHQVIVQGYCPKCAEAVGVTKKS
jgi:Fur family transcriptional regulator, peroxide stress response regulator